jgi:copper(I)-binding protein
MGPDPTEGRDVKDAQMIRPLLIALPLAVLAACGEPSSSARVTKTVDGDSVGVAVSDAWCRATPNGARAGACYATLRATGRDDRLIGVATAAAETVQVHEMRTEGGMMRMGELAGGLPLPEDAEVALAPGGTHVMLMGLAGPLVAGERVTLTLDFDQATDVTMEVPIRTAAEG